MFDGNKTATCAEFKPNPVFHPDNMGMVRTVNLKARKLLIASLGACATPSVLERSGVGSPGVLQTSGVVVIADVNW
jgi:alcohol oxidase